MRFMNSGRFRRENQQPEWRGEEPEPIAVPDAASTGSEAAYMRSLIDSRTVVTVALTTGEKVRGRIRYYDRDMFSIGPLAGGPNMFLRKSSVHSITEEA
jgi:hypothetical protein